MPFWGQDNPMPPFWGHDPVEHVSVEIAVKAVDKGALMIDLGCPDDWFAGHIPGALLVEPELFDMELERIPKDRPLIVAARDMGLGDEIVASLRERGYDAAALEGGVPAWRSAGQPLARADGTRTR